MLRCPRCERLHPITPLRAVDRNSGRPVGDGLHPLGKIICGKATVFVYERVVR